MERARGGGWRWVGRLDGWVRGDGVGVTWHHGCCGHRHMGELELRALLRLLLRRRRLVVLLRHRGRRSRRCQRLRRRLVGRLLQRWRRWWRRGVRVGRRTFHVAQQTQVARAVKPRSCVMHSCGHVHGNEEMIKEKHPMSARCDRNVANRVFKGPQLPPPGGGYTHKIRHWGRPGGLIYTHTTRRVISASSSSSSGGCG